MSSVHDPLLVVEAGMGKDRRRFLVVAIFDLCLITILWLICTVIKGSDWPSIFFKEINIFEPQFLKISLFDIVMIAVVRVFVLIFCYALLLVDHWLPVALTTFTTTIFLVVKVLFFFSHNPSGLPQYLVVISSLTIAWFELWLVPFRVLPRERRQLIVPIETPTSVIAHSRHLTTDDEFRSAISSGSDSEDERIPKLSSGRVFSKAEYSDAVDKAEAEVRQDMENVQFWKIVSRDPEIRFCDQKRIYYMRFEAHCSTQSLFKAVWKDNPLWNKHVTEFRVVLHIDPITELCYTTTAPAMRRYISARDFLDVRRARMWPEKDLYECFIVSVDSSILPANANKKMVRGFNGPNMFRFAKSEADPSVSVYEWIMNSDVKGDIPRRLVERATSGFLADYSRNLRNFLNDHAADYV